MRRDGFTLTEIMVSASLLSLVTGMLLLIYAQATRLSRQTDEQASMVADAQVGIAVLKQAVREGTYSGLTPAEESFAVMSPRGVDGDVELQDDGRSILWGSYRVFWRDSDSGQVFRRLLEIPELSDQRLSPLPVQSFDSGSGPHPLSFYFDQGKVLMKNVTVFEVTSDDALELVALRFILEAPARRGPKPTTLEFLVTERCRN